MMLRMRTLNIPLNNLLNNHIRIDLDLFLQLAINDSPLAGNLHGAHRHLAVDERVDAVGDVGESELVGRLADGLLVGDVVGCLCGGAAFGETVFDELRAGRFDVEVVVVEGFDDGVWGEAFWEGS